MASATRGSKSGDMYQAEFSTRLRVPRFRRTQDPSEGIGATHLVSENRFVLRTSQNQTNLRLVLSLTGRGVDSLVSLV